MKMRGYNNDGYLCDVTLSGETERVIKGALKAVITEFANDTLMSGWYGVTRADLPLIEQLLGEPKADSLLGVGKTQDADCGNNIVEAVDTVSDLPLSEENKRLLAGSLRSSIIALENYYCTPLFLFHSDVPALRKLLGNALERIAENYPSGEVSVKYAEEKSSCHYDGACQYEKDGKCNSGGPCNFQLSEPRKEIEEMSEVFIRQHALTGNICIEERTVLKLNEVIRAVNRRK